MQPFGLQLLTLHLHSYARLCNTNFFMTQKVCYIKQLQHIGLKEIPTKRYLDKIKIKKNFYLSFFPKTEKWT